MKIVHTVHIKRRIVKITAGSSWLINVVVKEGRKEGRSPTWTLLISKEELTVTV